MEFKIAHILALCALSIILIGHQCSDGLKVIAELERLLFKLNPDLLKGSPEEKLALIDWFMQDVLQRAIGNRPNNENGTKWAYKEYALLDESNDDAARLSGVSRLLIVVM